MHLIFLFIIILLVHAISGNQTHDFGIASITQDTITKTS